MSKAGVINLTLTAAREYAENGIRANAIVPGLIDTPQSRGSTGSKERFEQRSNEVALGRAGRPGDVANLMLFLASDESSFITGGSLRHRRRRLRGKLVGPCAKKKSKGATCRPP